MIHERALLDQLGTQAPIAFEGEVFRATRIGLDPLTFSTSGGRWAPRDGPAVLYTSQLKEGALSEIAFHWGQLNPRPSKPALVHRLGVSIAKSLRLLRVDLEALGIDWSRYGETHYTRMQHIGAAVNFLGADGLLVPCARWDCENLILFSDNLKDEKNLLLIDTESVDWIGWATAHNRLPDNTI